MLSHGEIVPFGDFSLGLGVQSLDNTEEGTVSFVMKGGAGFQLWSFLSVQASLWAWQGNDGGAQESQESEDRRNISFEGISASWEATLQLPFDNVKADFPAGPYYRYGQQCWSAVLTGLMESWSGRGCSRLQSIGVVLPSTHKTRAAFYIEASQTNFDDVASDAIQIGVKVPF